MPIIPGFDSFGFACNLGNPADGVVGEQLSKVGCVSSKTYFAQIVTLVGLATNGIFNYGRSLSIY